MHDFTTDLTKALASGINIKEFFRQSLERAINQLLEHELTNFLQYEKWSPEGYHSGNSRNGYYPRRFKTEYGELNLKVARDRLGEFEQHTLPARKQSSAYLEQTIIQLYQKGITTREIADIIEKMYGHHYSAATVSGLAKLVNKDVQAFHKREVKEKYIAIFCDATYTNVRRDGVGKEALHLLVGLDSQGYKEVLDYALYPTESSENYKEMLMDLKTRGLKEVLLFVSDGLTGLSSAVTDAFPKARHQSCWTHLQKNVMRKVRHHDRGPATEEVKRIYGAEDKMQALERLETFCESWGEKYPALRRLFSYKDNLFTFFDFPVPVQASLYTNNLAESLNKRLKRIIKVKEQFPNEASLERTVCSSVLEYNEKSERRIHRGFSSVQYELEQMFNS